MSSEATTATGQIERLRGAWSVPILVRISLLPSVRLPE